MDFPTNLLQVLTSNTGSQQHSHLHLADQTSQLRDCNDNIELYFANPISLDNKNLQQIPSPETLSLSLSLLGESLQNAIFNIITTKDDQHTLECRIRSTTSRLHMFVTNDQNNIQQDLIIQLLGATKNLLRWYLQLFLATQPPILPPPLACLQSNAMLEFYWTLMQEAHADNYKKNTQQIARNATLALFYATYPHSTAKENEGHAYLVHSLDFVPILLKLLIQDSTTPVLLSLIRLLHSVLGSMLPGTTQKVQHFQMEYQLGTAPWAPSNQVGITYKHVLFQILHWLIITNPFPGDASDRLNDLAVEILRVLYILRVAKTLDTSDLHLLHCILLLPTEQTYPVKLACVTLLMDAPPSSATFFLEHGLEPLLQIFDQQVSGVVNQTCVGTQAATAIMPILVLLHTLSSEHFECRIMVKEFIFPPEAEHAFWTKANQETKGANQNGNVVAKNMAPLDAPNGTLRWKLIRLLTWTESHIKRATQELLWTLCANDANDANEFVLRLGLGNVLPVLGMKGLVHLPSQLGS